ncbi:MAG TPA: DUF2304 domain-containing protein [Thermodesulfovibrionales bacterium]|jgi:amino acid transporter|nr:DUF2304 domain-containing protein [Thermodesulfovibrionales bacterium]
MDIIPFLTSCVTALILMSVVELIRRNRLKEKYSLLWLVAAFVMLFFSISRSSLEWLSLLVGIQYPPSFIFILAFLFLIVINVHFSTVISELFEKNKDLTQEVALLRKSLEEKREADN